MTNHFFSNYMLSCYRLVLFLIIFFFCLLLTVVLVKISETTSTNKENFEKLSPYECGFSPFYTERNPFDIKFYLVALLFLIFDVELMFLLPYVLNFFTLNTVGYLVFFLFSFILLLGLVVEWFAGSLEWQNLNKKKKKLKILYND